MIEKCREFVPCRSVGIRTNVVFDSCICGQREAPYNWLSWERGDAITRSAAGVSPRSALFNPGASTTKMEQSAGSSLKSFPRRAVIIGALMSPSRNTNSLVCAGVGSMGWWPISGIIARRQFSPASRSSDCTCGRWSSKSTPPMSCRSDKARSLSSVSIILHEEASVGLPIGGSVSIGCVSRGYEGTGFTARGVSGAGTAACGVSRGLTPRRGGGIEGEGYHP